MRALHALVLSSLLLLCGCLEIEQTVTIQADGSGTQTLRMCVTERLMSELRSRQAAARLGAGGDLSAVFQRELVQSELEDAGLELTAHKVVTEAGRRTVDLTAAFDGLGELQQSPLTGSAAEWALERGPKPGLAKLTLFPQGKAAWQEARARAAKMKGETDAVAAGFFRNNREKLKGLDIAFRFQLPGEAIVWTRSMEKVSERVVVARMTAAQIKTPEDLVRRLAPRFQVIFDARGLQLFE